MGVLQRSARNVVRKKSRMLLVVIAIALSMAIMISVPSGIMSNKAAVERLNNGYNDMMARTEAEINQTANLIECTYSFRSSGLYLNDSDVTAIGALPNVSAVVPKLNQMLSGTDSMITVNGVPLTSDFIDNYNILPTNLTEGRNLVPGDSGVAVIDTNLAEKLGISLEGQIDLNGTYFRVVGIYSPGSFQSQRFAGGFGGGPGFGQRPPGGGGFDPGQGGSYQNTDWRNMTRGTVYLSLGDAQKLVGATGQVNQLDVYSNDVAQVDIIALEIEANYTSLSVSTPKDRLERLQTVTQMFQSQIASSKSTLSSMEALAYQEIALALIATCMIVLFTMVYAVRERTKEVGVLKAIGFSNRDVLKQFLVEGLIICVLAGVVGVIIGNLAAPFLSSALLPNQTQQSTGQGGRGVFFAGGQTGGAAQTAVQFTPDLTITAAAFAVAVVMGIVGSLYPAWKASRISPMEALRYE
jgi:ABC-type antimicrobial peptide transport system permease subunit